MQRTRFVLLPLSLLLIFCLLFAACGGGDAQTTAVPQTTGASATTSAPQTTATRETSAAAITTEAPATTSAPATTGAPETTVAPTTAEQPATAPAGCHTVTFKVGGDEYAVFAPDGTVPTCPVDPEEVAGNDITIRFVGWDKEIAAVKADAVYTAVFENCASVAAAKNGAKGILTMTYDDGQYDTAAWVNQENKKYGLSGTCLMIAGRSSLSDNLDRWTALFADGTLEPQSHSMSHETMPAENSGKYADKKGNNTQPTYRYELVDAKTRLEELFPGRDIICFAPASNTLSNSSFALDQYGNADFSRPINDGGAEKVAQQTYYAIRRGARGIQSFDPTFGSEAGGWYNLRIQGFCDYDGDAILAAGKSWLDGIAENGGWLIVMCHGIEGPNARGTSPLEITEAAADAFFSHAGKYVKSGELWSASFGDATKYLRERQNTTVIERTDGDSVLVDMTINRTTKNGKYLAETVFNYPLTVEARVPSGWSSVYYFAEGKMKTAKTYAKEDGFTYVMVNLTPGADGAVVTTAINKLK